jgi:alanyl-tRNA synthetase
MSLPEAKAWGAVALFGETYDESVRVIQIGGPWSRELCGGTHVARSSQIGLVSITNESSVGSGSRRIEANVGLDAIKAFNQDRLTLQRLAESLKTSTTNAAERVDLLLTELKEAQRELNQLQAKALESQVPQLLASAKTVSGVKLISAVIPGVPSADALRELAVRVRDHVQNEAAVISLVAGVSDKPAVVVAVTKSAQDAGLNAGTFVKTACSILGGGGGGKPDLAQGGGTDLSKISEALLAIEKSIG